MDDPLFPSFSGGLQPCDGCRRTPRIVPGNFCDRHPHPNPTWPDGEVSVVKDLTAGTLISITRE